MALSDSALAGQAASPATATSPAARLTGRGAVLGMAMVFTVGLLMASWLGVIVLAGLLFVLGCALAAWFTRPPDLLIVVLTPPILFLCALIFVEALTASESLLLSVAAGSVVVLASLAPWLAVGLVATVAIALTRGLLRSIGDLVRDLRADAARRKRARAARPPGQGGLSRQLLRLVVPEPAGSGTRRPGDTKTTGKASPGPGGINAAGGARSPGARSPGTTKAPAPGSRGPGSTKAARPASRGPGSTKTATSASRGPSNAKGATPGPETRGVAPQAPSSTGRVTDAR